MISEPTRNFHPLRWAIVLAAMLISQWLVGTAPGQEAHRGPELNEGPIASPNIASDSPADVAPDSAFPPTAQWNTDRQRTIELAKQNKIAMLWYFTGDASWCPWCEKLEREVFETPAFAAWADGRVALLRIEYPHDPNAITDSERQHWTLIQRYRKYITGYPTVLFLTPDEQVVGKLGYLPGGPLAWTMAAQPFVAKRDKLAADEPTWGAPNEFSRFHTRERKQLAQRTHSIVVIHEP